jgi:hypothetical protein
MSFIYAGCLGVALLTALGILAATEELVKELRGRFP